MERNLLPERCTNCTNTFIGTKYIPCCRPCSEKRGCKCNQKYLLYDYNGTFFIDFMERIIFIKKDPQNPESKDDYINVYTMDKYTLAEYMEYVRKRTNPILKYFV